MNIVVEDFASSSVRSDQFTPADVECYADLMSIVLGFADSAFGRWSLRVPSLNSALTLETSMD